MHLDLNNPVDHTLAMDRHTAGVNLMMGPTNSRRRLKETHQDHVDKLQRQRHVDELQRLRDTPRQRPSLPVDELQRLYINMDLILFDNLSKQNHAKKLQAPLIKYDDSDEMQALAQRMLDAYVVDGTEPLVTMLEPFDDMSSEDEYDPNSGLPYIPRLKINRRRVDAALMISNTVADLAVERRAAECAARTLHYHCTRVRPWLHVRAMKQVAAEIRKVGATKRSKERSELGPAPHGFSYVQLENQVYLVADNGDGSMVYIAEASAMVICR
ncbi:hypothetical protein FB451DRAFT_1183319 [Mycena latifolia]|nr:hypothetical protein FB451DRAFT_1183319 [Mycena latifolia]